MADDLNFQKISTVQSSGGTPPATIASTTISISPASFVTFISGTAQVGTINPPVNGAHMICLIFTNGSPGSFLTTGNIKATSTLVTQNVPYYAVYDPLGAKYYISVDAK